MNLNEMSPEELKKIRQTALALAERAKSDEEFRAQIQQQPLETLIQAGLPRETIGEFLRETQIIDGFDAENDVSGFDDFSTICIVSAKM